MFNVSKCVIKTVYCGNGNKYDKKKYTKKGTSNECLKKGFGAGANNEKLKHLPKNSLQTIPYVGEKMEKNFIKNNIKNTDQLINKLLPKSQQDKEKILKKVLVDKLGRINIKAYNSTILFLHNKGMQLLPNCL